jgi:endonuclease IV
MSQSEEQKEKEEELKKAIENMDEALEKANGICAKRIRGRTTATRRALLEIAKEEV